MTQITLNIPDKELDFFLNLVKKFKYKTVQQEGIYISPEQMKMVDQRRKSAKKSDFISKEDANKKLKAKYGF